MLEIILEIINNYVAQSSSHEYTQKHTKNKVINILLEKCLHTREFVSEYIFFGKSMEKKIARQKCDEIEDTISINIDWTEWKSDHKKYIINKYTPV